MAMMSMVGGDTDGPRVDRIRHEVKVRSVTFARTERVTPAMLRITLIGDDLADFGSAGFDDHVKLLVPGAAGATERRDYTPRRFDPAARTLTLDFALHEAGLATAWALAAKPGDAIQVAGPKGSAVIAADRWLLIGDETGLPAIGRCIEEAAPGSRVTSVVAVAGPADEQGFATQADLTALWAYRPVAAAADPAPLLRALDGLRIDPGTFVWIAAEAGVARAVRQALIDRAGLARGWIKAAGYWVMGRADAHERIG